MKHKLTYTDNYILVLDDSEIKEGECYLSPSGIWFYNHLNPNHVKECKKIIAHLPLNNSTILEGVPLLPPLEVEDDVENLAEHSSELQEGTYTIQHKVTYKHGFIDGHTKAKEKYKYTEEDMRKAIEMARTLVEGKNEFDVENILGSSDGTYGIKQKYSEKEIIQSISQPKMPTHFECETEWVNSYGSPTVQYDVQELNPKTTTNSQGQVLWVGKWIYE